MKVATITQASEAQKIKVESAVERLEIKLKSTHASALVTFSDFINQIDEIEVEVTKNTRNGSITVLQRTNMLDLFELAQGNGGLVEAYQLGLANVIQSAIEVSAVKGQAIALGNQEFFEVNFFNWPVVANNTFEIEVYATDAEQIGFTHILYAKQFFNDGSPREIDVREAGLLAIPYALCDKVEITYPNQRRVKLTKNELIFRQRDEFIIRSTLTATNGQASVNVLNRMILVDVARAIKAEVTLTGGSANVVVVKAANL